VEVDVVVVVDLTVVVVATVVVAIVVVPTGVEALPPLQLNTGGPAEGVMR
jgi:hypothetical protein